MKKTDLEALEWFADFLINDSEYPGQKADGENILKAIAEIEHYRDLVVAVAADSGEFVVAGGETIKAPDPDLSKPWNERHMTDWLHFDSVEDALLASGYSKQPKASP